MPAECYGAVPGATILGIAAPPLATTTTPTTATTMSVFELFVALRGLNLSPLHFCPLALYTVVFTLLFLAFGDRFFFNMAELPIIQKTYDLIKWYVPILNRLPRQHKFTLGDRMSNGLYDLLESLIAARYAKNKLPHLENLNSRLDVLRHQTRLLLDFNLMDVQRYEYAGKLLNSIGSDLGGWIKSQRTPAGTSLT
jgi:hypothetical protein